MAGAFLLPVYVSFYQGLKEITKCQYFAPKLSKKIKGNAGWMEVRARQPAPGSLQLNEDSSAREHLRHHYKVPYPYSRYYVRNFWDPAKEYGVENTVRVLPELASFTPEQEKKFLGYIEGDDLGNQMKKKRFEDFSKEMNGLNNPKEWSEETKRRIQRDLRFIFKPMLDSRKEKIELDAWEDSGDFPGASPYYANPDTYLYGYGGVYHMSSYELQLFIEIEKYLEDFRDKAEENGLEHYEGKAENWKILDNSHRADQQREVVKNLKQRNIKNIA